LHDLPINLHFSQVYVQYRRTCDIRYSARSSADEWMHLRKYDGKTMLKALNNDKDFTAARSARGKIRGEYTAKFLLERYYKCYVTSGDDFHDQTQRERERRRI